MKRTPPTDGWLIYDADDNCIGFGTGAIELQDGERIVLSDNPSEEPDALAIKQSLANIESGYRVEAKKTDAAYSAKLLQAREIVAGDTYDPIRHDFIEQEVRLRSTSESPLETAQSIVAAARASTLQQEEERIILRESLK